MTMLLILRWFLLTLKSQEDIVKLDGPLQQMLILIWAVFVPGACGRGCKGENSRRETIKNYVVMFKVFLIYV